VELWSGLSVKYDTWSGGCTIAIGSTGNQFRA